MAVAIVSERLLNYRAEVADCIQERGYMDALDSGPRIHHLGHWLAWLDAAPPKPEADMRAYGHELLDQFFAARERGSLPW